MQDESFGSNEMVSSLKAELEASQVNNKNMRKSKSIIHIYNNIT